MGITRAHLIQEYRRIHAEDPSMVLGERRFQSITRIPRNNWRGKNGFRCFGELVKEAVGTSNSPDKSYELDFLISSLVKLAQKNRRFPTEADIRLERTVDENYPSKNAFRKLGTHGQRIDLSRQYVNKNPEYSDVLEMLPQVPEQLKDELPSDKATTTKPGYVYMGLLKIGPQKRYKIGNAVLVEQRHSQLSLQLPEDLELIHAISTDDAYGIEAYWHKRFASKNTKGEWFSLSREDVQAFKRRRFM